MLDEELILRQLRDSATREAAFVQVVRAYQESLYWLIRRIVLTHENADDVLQNVFMKAWMGLDNFKAESKLGTWIYRIAVNESINYRNRQKDAGSYDESSDVLKALTSDSYFDGDEVQLQLQKAIDLLPDKQRVVFNLRYFQEMSYKEMSEILGTSEGALKASYHHAVNKIVQYFKSID
ncbi:MAG: sigma-70 family RNA polymerase sigma factor [Bacteroidaceae bacterium]|nr:sigma-70 family RNA polymerase sigma factor [Bacteroidaceae bacterium]